MATIQRQLSNGMWIDITEDHARRLIDQILANESWYAPRVNREPMTTPEQVLALLDNGKSLSYDADWYANIRSLDAYERQQAALRAAQPPVEYVQCDCGHRVRRVAVMSASLGTSCPDCYDRMSD